MELYTITKACCDVIISSPMLYPLDPNVISHKQTNIPYQCVI